MILRDVSKSLAKSKTMKDSTKLADARIDKFLDSHASGPWSARDERIRWEIKNMSKGVTVWQALH